MTAKENVPELTSKEFSEMISKEKDRLVVVDFYAEWCTPCVMMAPILESIAERLKKVVFAKVNIDEAEELAQKCRVSSVPCIVFFKGGEEVGRIAGAASEEELENKISLLYK